MERLKIREFTTSAENRCLFSSKSEAELYFLRLGATGKTNLCWIKDVSGRDFILWLNDNGKESYFLPLFTDELEIPDISSANITLIDRSTFIYHKRDEMSGTSYLAIAYNGDMLIRQVRIFADQEMVENYCASQNIKPSGIYLCKLCTVQENSYIATCWSIEYDDPNDLDENGEPMMCERLLPVDTADSVFLQDLGIADINNVYLHDGDTFRSQGTIYRVLKDQNGKFFLTHELFTKPETAVEPSTAESEKADENETKCKIVSFRPK